MARKKESDPKTTTSEQADPVDESKGPSLAQRIRARIKSALRKRQNEQVSGNGDRPAETRSGRPARSKASEPVAETTQTPIAEMEPAAQIESSGARAARGGKPAAAVPARSAEDRQGEPAPAEEPAPPEVPTAAPAAAVARAQAPEPAETRVSLLVRDPVWIYAYWELTRDKRELFRVNHRKMALRVYDLGDPGNGNKDESTYFDIGVMPKTRGWYIRTPRSHRVWKVTVGVFDSDGNYLPICASNTVETPRAPLEQATRVAGPVWNVDAEEGTTPAAALPRGAAPPMPRFEEPAHPPGQAVAGGPQPASVKESHGSGEQVWTEEERLREIFFASLGDEEDEFSIPGASEMGSRRRSRAELAERESVRLRELRRLGGGASELGPGASNLGIPKKP